MRETPELEGELKESKQGTKSSSDPAGSLKDYIYIHMYRSLKVVDVNEYLLD